jgi:branched-chain amino acid transport system ATP-binding protein
MGAAVGPAFVTAVGGLPGGVPRGLLVDHHWVGVPHLADRVAVMHHGAMLVCDTPAVVMANRTVQEAYLGEDL